jgi:hypothetical protein
LRELVDRLLAASTSDGAYQSRHALLAEAVAGRLLPGERVVLHERTARALAAVGDEKLAGEVARHWAAAGRIIEELPTRVAAAEAAVTATCTLRPKVQPHVDLRGALWGSLVIRRSSVRFR